MTIETPASRGRTETLSTRTRFRVIVPETALVLSRDGELPAQHLSPGDDLVAREGGFVSLSSICRSRVAMHFVWITDGFLPGMAQAGGVFLPATQPVLMRRAGRIVESVASDFVTQGWARDIGLRRMTMIELCLGARDTIFGGGIELVAQSAQRGQRRQAA